MKQKFTLIIAALFVAGLYSACKKDISSAPKTAASSAVSESAMARQMALGLYQSFSANFNSSSQKTNGLKTAAYAGCGAATVTPTDKTVVSGDTTRKYQGRSIYTTLCSKDEWVVDSYTLYDTLKTTETGPGFSNSYTNTQYFYVKGPMQGFVSVTGTVTAGSHLSKVNAKGITTEFHDIATQYALQSLAVNPFAEGNKFMMGQINFATSTVDLDATTDRDGLFTNYSGYIFYLNNTARIYFKHPTTYGYVRYIYDFSTGQMTGPVNSYGFPMDAND